jgi:crotonobetainyl-CoA:carnitine CoA-transferase CaiB-like acyl-CoA transferase
MAGPLAGIRVVEIAQEIQGPYAAMHLADLGAEVLKVETPKIGDLSRHMKIKLIAPTGAQNPEFSHYFLAMNRGKKSITLDLKNAAAKEVLWRLIERADVLVTNYRPGVLDRLGFPWEELHRRNSRLVLAQGSSWGPRGPWRTRPSRDTLAQAVGGLMAKTGPDSGEPHAAGALVADHSGALTLLSGILAALFARERTGRGQRVDVSIYGTVLALQPMELNFSSLSGLETPRAGRGHQFLHGVWGAFATKDGHICLAGVDDKRWPAFCEVMGIAHLRDDPAHDNVTRNYHGYATAKVLDEIFPTRTTAYWMERLTAIDVLAAPVASYQEILASEQAAENGYLTHMQHPDLGKIKIVGSPIGLSETPVTISAPPPELGANTEEILLDAGYSWEEVEALRDKGAT